MYEKKEKYIKITEKKKKVEKRRWKGKVTNNKNGK